MITKRECQRRAAALRTEAVDMLAEAQRIQVGDDLGVWRLRDDALGALRKAENWQRLADGAMWDRWVWSELTREDEHRG